MQMFCGCHAEVHPAGVQQANVQCNHREDPWVACLGCQPQQQLQRCYTHRKCYTLVYVKVCI